MSSLNVDPVEIDKFQSIASRWWDTESEFKPLHDINPLRCDYIEQRSNGLKDKRVLDIGCGGGILAEALTLRGANVTGIDMADMSLKVAKMHLHESQLDVDYQLTTAEAFSENNAGSFDVVTCLEMLEHVPDPESIVASAARLLKPGGDLFFSTINRNPKSFALAILGAEYLLNMVPKGTHDYKRFIKPSELASAIRANELSLLDITGITYNPFTKNYKLSRDIDVNFILHCTSQ
jgi:2-polyprenyl-6-hydroxyphenyl methylase/3-demethylubiquinone-9 3-methyltransferase